MPASMVSMEVITACAGKGEILAVCFTEGGLHSDLALFLGSEVRPTAAVEHEGTNLGHQRGKGMPSVVGSGGGTGADGFVTVGVDSQSSTTTIVLKPGFRLILFETSFPSSSSSFSSFPSSSTSSSPLPLIFLQDSPDALAGVQFVRFGGVDSVGVAAPDDGMRYLNTDNKINSPAVDAERVLTSSSIEDSGSDSNSDSSSTEPKETKDAPVPSFVLAGMGLTRQPGFEMSRMIGARLEDEIVRAFATESGPSDEAEQQELEEPVMTVVTAQREALVYSGQLSATHEAVIALLAARPPCFEADLPRFTPDITVPSGGEPTTGVSDDVERDQNRVLNNLIETLFAYKTTLEKGVETVPQCDRASQEKISMTNRKAEQLGNRLALSTVRFLARCGDMLHVWGSDPALYSPVFPGVRALIHGVFRRAADVMGARNEDGEGIPERIIMGVLTRSMVTRVADECEWIIPLAALAVSSPGDLPAEGWWDTSVALLADRRGGINEAGGIPSRLTLVKLLRMVVAGSGGGRMAKLDQDPADGKDNREIPTEPAYEHEAMVQGLAQVGAVVDPWLEYHESEVPELKTSEDGTCSEDSSSEAGDDDTSRHSTILSPQRWDLGFDTSGWARDRGAAAVAALARDRGIPFGTNGRRGDENNDSFFSALSLLWTAAKADRAMMNAMQAADAKPFSDDEILCRLVFLEATMNCVFARLPGYVMCEASQWFQWIAEVRRSLSVVEGGGDSSSIGSLRYLLSHPPPAFVSQKKVSDDISSSTSSSSQDGDSNLGSDSGEDVDNAKVTKGHPIAEECPREVSDLSCAKDETQPRAIAGKATTLEQVGGEGAGHSKVRRDSRERMKIKLGLLDGLGMAAAGSRNGNNGASAETKIEFNARASSLFGVSTSTTRGVILAGKPSSSAGASRAAENENALPRSGPSGQGFKSTTSMVTVNSSVAVNGHGEDSTDEDEECKFITFVAESFRPQRDNSDWHKEAKPVPPPQNVSKDATVDLVMANQEVIDMTKDETVDVADTDRADKIPAVDNDATADEEHKGDATQQISPAVTSSVTPLCDTRSELGASLGSRASSGADEERRVNRGSPTKEELAILSEQVFKMDASR